MFIIALFTVKRRILNFLYAFSLYTIIFLTLIALNFSAIVITTTLFLKNKIYNSAAPNNKAADCKKQTNFIGNKTIKTIIFD